MMTATRRLEIEALRGVTVVSFRDQRIVNEDVIREIGEEFRGLVAERGRRSLVVNFDQVEAMSSAILPVLLYLRKRVETTEGRLRLCCVHPELKEVFDLHRPRKSPPLFQLYDDEQSALDSL
jgi:anti-sigma B factor antagonist